MIVVDASVMTNALTDDGPVGARARSELGRDTHWAAPEHFVVEVFSTVRGRWLGRKIGRRRAEDAVSAVRSAALDLIAGVDLLPRMWQLRDNVSGYDAAYIAAAELCQCVLITADRRLAHVSGVDCAITLALESS